MGLLGVDGSGRGSSRELEGGGLDLVFNKLGGSFIVFCLFGLVFIYSAGFW